MEKVKVLHIITRLDPGGSSTNTIETAARLDPQRFDVFLISGRTKDTDGGIEELLKSKCLKYAFFPDLQREIHPWKDIMAFIQLYHFIKKRRFDIVHTHTSKAGILGRFAARCAGVPVVIHTPHGHVFYGYFSKALTTVFIWVERTTARITDKIITLTDRGKEEHLEFKIGPTDKFVRIYSGIDLSPKLKSSDLKHQLKKQWEINGGNFIFGCVGRLDPIKGTTYLIDAMAQVVKKHPKTRLLLVGDGSQKEKLQEQCRALGLLDLVKFTGFQKDPASFIEIMDVFVLASLNEGMGRVILEAMVYGKPIIATKVGGVPELVHEGKNGLLVPPQNADALSAAMIKLVEHQELREEMSKQSKTIVGAQFDLDKMVKDIEGLYNQLLKSL